MKARTKAGATTRTKAGKTATKKPGAKTSAKASAKTGSKASGPQAGAAPKRHRVFGMSFASVYPLYVKKAESKGRTQAEVDQVIAWLTGYRADQLRRVLDDKVDFEGFYANAPRMNPNVGLITGVVCGVRVEEVADPLMKKIRYLDKLIDELAKGKKLESILRS